MSSKSTQYQSRDVCLEPMAEQPLHEQSRNDPTENADESPPYSPDTLFKLASAGLSFFCAGMNDGSLGVLIPVRWNYLDGIMKYTDRFFRYVTTFTGWLFIAIINTHLYRYCDLGLLLAVGAILQLIAQILRSWRPPLSLYAITFSLQSMGMALQDTHSNNWVTSVKLAHRWLGFIHAMYALGCWIGPLIATPIAAADQPSRWYLYYTGLVGTGAANLIMVILAFRDSLRRKSTKQISMNSTAVQDPVAADELTAFAEIEAILTLPAVWLLSLYFFCFLGAALTASGWVVEYLVSVRGGELSKMGYVQTGFAGGTFLGRILLAEPTKRFGERRMVLIYALICLSLELVFWLVPNIVISAVVISIFGFFSGPFFATGVSVASQIFPPHLRPSALALVFMLGQIGGAVFPAITGLVASRVGVKVLQPVLVGLCSATAVVWLLVPKIRVHRD